MSTFVDNTELEACIEDIKIEKQQANITKINEAITNDSDLEDFFKEKEIILKNISDKTDVDLKEYFKKHVLNELEQKFEELGKKLKNSSTLGGSKNKKSKKFNIIKGGTNDIRAKLVALVVWIAGTLGSRALVIYFLSQPEIAKAFGILTPCTTTYDRMLNVFTTAAGGMSCLERQQRFMEFVNVLTGVISGIAGVANLNTMNYRDILENVTKYIESETCKSEVDATKDVSVTNAPVTNTPVTNTSDNNQISGGGRSRKNKNKKNNKKRKTNRRKRTNRRK